MPWRDELSRKCRKLRDDKTYYL